jgi:hypothetical protein
MIDATNVGRDQRAHMPLASHYLTANLRVRRRRGSSGW